MFRPQIFFKGQTSHPDLYSMAPFLFFLILSSLNVVLGQQRYSNITLNSSLTPTTNPTWLSPSGLYAFGFFQQNNAYAVGIFLAGISEKTVVWTANRDNPTVSSDVILVLTGDGRLILQQREGPVTNIVDASQPIASASMLDNGNFVLYNSNMTIIWQSFDYPTNTLLPGQRLITGGQLFSSASEIDYSKGIFMLIVQLDGYLVQYPVGTPFTIEYGYYSLGTPGGVSDVSLNLDDDGHLYLLRGSSFFMNVTGGYPETTTSSSIAYLMRIDVDGIFRLYSHSLDRDGNWNVRWSSTTDVCDPKGICGINAFCVQMDTVPNCNCLQGFNYVQPGNGRAGCERNIIAVGCNSSTVNYEIRAVSNTVWEDNSYAALDAVTDEDCKKACLDDCNCGAAFFKDGQCRKQKFPLRFGRRLLTDSNVALVKVSTTQAEDRQGKVEVKKDLRLDILIISISLFVSAIIIMALSWIYISRKHVLVHKEISKQSEIILIEDVSLRAFTYEDLQQATNDFKEELGRGASGTVYKGILEKSKKVVAVKRLEKEFEDGDREFQTEMKVIGRTYHRNLVRLLGYCIDQTKRLLVFEYMSNGSLADMLFKSKNQPFPSWGERMEIARHIARGILYLHEECETQIIHCDIKPQNILLDEQGCAKISDFGLSKLLKQNQTKTYTGIRGTKGYVAPEWHQKLPITVKADVYSFGIVLLEIICCRKSVDWSLPEDEAILEEWVYNCYEAGEIEKLVGDEVLFDKTKLERMVKIGIWCIQEDPSLRPSIKKVVLMLEGSVEIPIPPNPTSFLGTSI